MKKGSVSIFISENERFLVTVRENPKSDFEKMKELGRNGIDGQVVFNKRPGELEEKTFVAVTIDETMIIVREQIEALIVI